MSTSWPSSSACNSFSILFIHLTFFYVLSVPIFYFEIGLRPLHSVAGLFLCILHFLDDRILLFILEYPALMVFLHLVTVSFKSPFFR